MNAPLILPNETPFRCLRMKRRNELAIDPIKLMLVCISYDAATKELYEVCPYVVSTNAETNFAGHNGWDMYLDRQHAIFDWIEENSTGFWTVHSDLFSETVQFQNENDALLYKLRWS